MDTPQPTPVLVCAAARSLRASLEASLADNGFVVAAVAAADEAIAMLKEADHAALILEAPRDSFSRIVQFATRLRPRMPIHVIDGNAVFCFYPLGRQPFELIDAVMAAGVSISPELLRHTRADRPRPAAAPEAFMI
jgi:CheY-like chemotaxis protein